jgi:hypothetical protein
MREEQTEGRRKEKPTPKVYVVVRGLACSRKRRGNDVSYQRLTGDALLVWFALTAKQKPGNVLDDLIHLSVEINSSLILR